MIPLGDTLRIAGAPAPAEVHGERSAEAAARYRRRVGTLGGCLNDAIVIGQEVFGMTWYDGMARLNLLYPGLSALGSLL
jgi:hypothetical protein